jgi:hypothetical protein
VEPRRQNLLGENMDKRIVNSKEYKNFLKISQDMVKFFKLKSAPPPDEHDHYLKVLAKYGKLLDKLNIANAIPLYRYKHDDKSTWRYLNVIIKGKRFIRWIENPEFKAV